MTEFRDLDLLPDNFWTPDPHAVQISVTSLDEFGLPFNRRGVKVGVPRPGEVKEFAAEGGELVKKTLEFMFGDNSV